MSAASLERNRYFFGKMMDVAQFEKEQNYFRSQLALLNRLVIGTGVVCGLEVAADTGVKGNVSVAAGVALDGAGRFVIVPAATSVNPAQLTDDQGKPQGSPVTSGSNLISLCYAESCADPAAVFTTDCDTPGACAATTTVESFRIIVQAAPAAPPAPLACPIQDFAKISAADLQKTLAALISGACPAPSATCVPLARVDVASGSIDAVSDRPLVYGNHLLMQLALCLKGS
jgi:hypothetical protein